MEAQAEQLSFWFFWVEAPASLTIETGCSFLLASRAAEASPQEGEQTCHCPRHPLTQSSSGGACFLISALAETGGAIVGVASAAFGGGAL